MINLTRSDVRNARAFSCEPTSYEFAKGIFIET